MQKISYRFVNLKCTGNKDEKKGNGKVVRKLKCDHIREERGKQRRMMQMIDFRTHAKDVCSSKGIIY